MALTLALNSSVILLTVGWTICSIIGLDLSVLPPLLSSLSELLTLPLSRRLPSSLSELLWCRCRLFLLRLSLSLSPEPRLRSFLCLRCLDRDLDRDLFLRFSRLVLLLRDLFLLFLGFSSSESEDNSTTEFGPEASFGMTSFGGAGGGQILTAVTDPVSCNVKTESLGTLERRGV